MDGGGERKRKLTLDWDKILPIEDEDTILVAKPPATAKKPMTEDGENSSTGNDFQNMTTEQLIDLIKRLKVMCHSIGDKLPDHGEKLLAELKRFEEELERRKIGVLNITNGELISRIERMKVVSHSICPNLLDHGEKFLARLKLFEEELERRKHLQDDGRNKKPAKSVDRTHVEDMFDPGPLKRFVAKKAAKLEAEKSRVKGPRKLVGTSDREERRALNNPSQCPHHASDPVPFPVRPEKRSRSMDAPPHVRGLTSPPSWGPSTEFSSLQAEDTVFKSTSRIRSLDRVLIPSLIDKYEDPDSLSQGRDALRTFSVQCLSAAEGIIRCAEASTSRVDKLTRMLEAERRKYDSEKVRLELEKKKLEEEKVELETRLQATLDRERRVIKDAERAQATADARQRRIAQLEGEKERIVMETINEFKKSNEYDTIMGKYGMDSYKYGLKQARAWVKLHAPNLDPSVFKDFPSAAEDLDLSQFPDLEPDQASPDGTLPEGS